MNMAVAADFHWIRKRVKSDRIMYPLPWTTFCTTYTRTLTSRIYIKILPEVLATIWHQIQYLIHATVYGGRVRHVRTTFPSASLRSLFLVTLLAPKVLTINRRSVKNISFHFYIQNNNESCARERYYWGRRWGLEICTGESIERMWPTRYTPPTCMHYDMPQNKTYIHG